MILKRLLLLLIGMTFLAACNGTVLTRTDFDSFYDPTLPAYIAQSGYFPAEIYGAPFGQKGHDEILSHLALPARYTQVPFKDVRGTNTGELGRLVLVFNPAQVPSARAPCQNADGIKLASGDGERINVRLAFCFGDAMVSETSLSAPWPAGVMDPSLHRYLAHAIYEVFPYRNPNGADCEGSKGVC